MPQAVGRLSSRQIHTPPRTPPPGRVCVPRIVQGGAQQQGGGNQGSAHRHADEAGEALLDGLAKGGLGADDAGDAGIEGAELAPRPPAPRYR